MQWNPSSLSTSRPDRPFYGLPWTLPVPGSALFALLIKVAYLKQNLGALKHEYLIYQTLIAFFFFFRVVALTAFTMLDNEV